MSFNQNNTKAMNVEEMNSYLIFLAKSERNTTAEILSFLVLFQKCGGPMKFGCSSLYHYLTRHLHYSDDQAYRRLKAAKLLAEIPAVIEPLKSGALTLSQAAKTQKAFDSFKKEKNQELDPEAKKVILLSLAGLDNFNTERVLAETLKLKKQSSTLGDKVKPLADSSVRVEVTLSKEQYEKLKCIKGLVSHQAPEQDLATVFNILFDFYLGKKGVTKEITKKSNVSESIDDSAVGKNIESAQEINKVENKTQKHPEMTQPFMAGRVKNQSVLSGDLSKTAERKAIARDAAEGKVKSSRYIPKQVRSELFQRSKGCCEFVGPGGARCGSQYKVQVDHIVPFSLGGSSVNINNLQTLCSTHNQLAASQIGIGYETLDLFEGIGFM